MLLGVVSNAKQSLFQNESQLKEIRVDSFLGCYSLQSSSSSASVTIIGRLAFDSRRNLNKVSFSDKSSLSKIGIGAIHHCTSIESFDVPNVTEIIDREVFRDCSA